MDKKKLAKETRVDDALDEDVKSADHEDADIEKELASEHELDERIEQNLEKEEILDEEIKTDEEIAASGGRSDKFFASEDMRKAKRDKARLSADTSDLIDKREALEKDVERKMVDKIKKESKIRKEAEERESLED